MWARRAQTALLVFLACHGCMAEDVEPSAFYSDTLYEQGYAESLAPVTLSDDGTLVTWWHRDFLDAGTSEYDVITWDAFTGDQLLLTKVALITPTPTGVLYAGPPALSAIGSDGFIIHAGDHFLAATDPVGNPWWQVVLGGFVSTSVNIAADESIIVGDYEGVLYCFEANGDPRWAVALPGIAFNHAAIQPDGQSWFAVKYPDASWGLVAVDADGTLAVEVATGTVTGSPSIGADGRVLVAEFTGTPDDPDPPPESFVLRAYETDGSLAWEAPIDGQGASAITAPSGTVFVAAQRSTAGESGHLIALAGNNGAELWRTELEGDIFQPALLDNGVIVVGCGQALCGYDSGNGVELFAYPGSSEGGGTLGPPLARDGQIIATTGYAYLSWMAGGHVNTEPNSWARLGGNDRMTGQAP